MFKPRQSRRNPVQSQSPISDMEQFYLNQYFRAHPNPLPTQQVYPSQPHSQRFPPIELARLSQLESRIARIEDYLGLSSMTAKPESVSRPF